MTFITSGVSAVLKNVPIPGAECRFSPLAPTWMLSGGAGRPCFYFPMRKDGKGNDYQTPLEELPSTRKLKGYVTTGTG